MKKQFILIAAMAAFASCQNAIQSNEETIDLPAFASTTPVIDGNYTDLNLSVVSDSTQGGTDTNLDGSLANDSTQGGSDAYDKTKLAKLANVIVISPVCNNELSTDCVSITYYDSTGMGSDAKIVKLVNGKLPSIRLIKDKLKK